HPRPGRRTKIQPPAPQWETCQQPSRPAAAMMVGTSPQQASPQQAGLLPMRFHVLATALVLGLASAGGAQAERLTDQPLVDAAWLNDLLGAPGLVIIDIRDKTKDGAPYAAGYVPGAVEAQY